MCAESQSAPRLSGSIRLNKFCAFFIILPGAIGFEAEEFADAEGGFGLAEILRGNAVARKIFFGEVDAADDVVVVDVADDVGQLKGQAEFFGEVERAGIVEAEDVGAGQADRSGDAIAVFAEAIEGRVGAKSQIHLGAADEIVEVARGHFVALHGVDESGQNFGFARQGL